MEPCPYNQHTSLDDFQVIDMRRRRHNHNQRRKIIKDGWADYEGEVVRSEDIQLE